MGLLRASLVLVGGWALLSACADLVGITDLPDASDAALPPTDGSAGNLVCPGSKTVIITTDSLHGMQAGGGYVFVMPSSGGVARCVAGGTCSVPTNFLALDPNAYFEGYAVDSLIHYTQQGGADNGSVHTAALDGTNDQRVVGNLAAPTEIATSGGSRTFWLDDTTQPAVHCIGCNGSDAVWMSGFASSGRMWADANDVYVMTSDGGSTGTTDGIYGCHASGACGTSYRTVATGIDSLGFADSDGTNVYVWRYDYNDILSIDQSNSVTTLASAVGANDLKVDAATHELFYLSWANEIVRMPTTGGSPVTLTTCDASFGTPDSIALDATNVYVLVELSSFNYAVYALPR